MIVALIPLGVLGLLNERATRAALITNANELLRAAALQTTAAIDAFVRNNLNAIRTEAKLPALAKYLKLPSSQRFQSAQETEIIEIMRTLSLKDIAYISSYALLDLQGKTLVDTWGADTGMDKSDYDYFQQPLQTGLPYASPVQASVSAPGETGLYFSSPVRDKAGEIIGVLSMRYRVSILQRLIVQHNNLGGKGSFAILLDENHLYLGHGINSRLVFQSVMPLDAAQLATLKNNRRLPADAALSSTHLPEFERSLNDRNQPYFTTRLDNTDNKLISAAITEAKTQPWLIVYTQPQAVFLSPIQAQTWNTILLAVAIATIVAVAAPALARSLSNPITRLTAVAEKIRGGDLTARAKINFTDETGMLGMTFNSMTTQLSDLINDLDQKVAERTTALSKTNEELESANQELQDFAYIVSHDLKAPLRAIGSLADWLASDYNEQLDDEGRELIDLLVGRVNRMHGLIEGILQYSRAGMLKSEQVSVDLQQLVKDNIKTLAPPENIHIHIKNQLPTVVGEDIRLEQVFQNLLSNAIKYIDKPEGRIDIDCLSDNGYWQFSIADNGPGIEEKHFGKIFQIFQTLTSRDEMESTGIGLSLVKRIVEMHGGKVWVKSTVGVGSTFFFTLPQVSQISEHTHADSKDHSFS